MDQLSRLQAEIAQPPQDTTRLTAYYLALGFAQHFDDPVPLARAHAFASLLTSHRKVIFTHDRIAGSIRGCMRDDLPISDAALTRASGIVTSYGSNNFLTNADHFAPDYKTFLADGVAGTLDRIRSSRRQHQEDPDAVKKLQFLDAAEIAMQSFGTMVGQYSDAAAALAAQVPDPIQKNPFIRDCTGLQETGVSQAGHVPGGAPAGLAGAYRFFIRRTLCHGAGTTGPVPVSVL